MSMQPSPVIPYLATSRDEENFPGTTALLFALSHFTIRPSEAD